MTNEIKHPNETTYFIAYNEAHEQDCHYGIVEPSQVMATKKENVFQTTDKEEWIEELAKCGINYTEEL